MNTTYDVALEELTIPAPDSTVLARERHVAVIRGCVDCHKEKFDGDIFLDDPVVGRIVASNLTSGQGGIDSTYSNQDWIRAIRHGVGPDGKPLVFMPSHEFYPLGQKDLGALIAYLKQLPGVNHQLPGNSIGPMARLLYMASQLPLLPAERINHQAPHPEAPVPAPTAAYGKYMTSSCTGCHGEGFSGGPIPSVPPEWPPAANITLDKETGIGSWTEKDFFRALRKGRRPDDSVIRRPYMPWHLTAKMTDTEIQAIWEYLQTTPPTPKGNR